MSKIRRDFESHSIDFLRLLGDKARRGESNKTAAQEASILEMFYDGIELLFEKYENEMHALNIAKINSDVKCKMMETELMNMMRAATKSNVSEEVYQAFINTDFQLMSEADLKKPVGFKVPVSPNESQIKGIVEKYKSGKVSLREVFKHFSLNEDQLIKMIDTK